MFGTGVDISHLLLMVYLKLLEVLYKPQLGLVGNIRFSCHIFKTRKEMFSSIL